MAEIQIPNGGKQKGKRRSKKLSTKIDLTPMVDLGFLLITFFVFTATFSKPKVTLLNMPDDGESTTGATQTISLLLAANNEVYYYNGDSINNVHKTDFSPHGLRDVIIDKKKAVLAKIHDANETVVLIKPTEDAVYSNIVAALDEMQINVIKRYVLMDPSPEEIANIK